MTSAERVAVAIVRMTYAHVPHVADKSRPDRKHCSGVADPLTGNFCQFSGTAQEQHQHVVERAAAVLNQGVPMSAETELNAADWRYLATLPVGSVVMARHKAHGDAWPWVKTDDTELVDEYGDRVSTAWACVAYTADRTDADLLIESDAVVVVWHGGQVIRPGGPA